MSALEVERKCSVRAAGAVRLARPELERLGYRVTSADDEQLEAVYAEGSYTSLRLPEHKHHLRLSADGVVLRFVFKAGYSQGLVVQSERAELERRADLVTQVVLETAQRGDRPPPARCEVCAAPAPAEGAVCATCGSPLR